MKAIIFVSDALRADHLSCYGYERETSPKIDELSKDSLMFKQATAHSTWTRASAGTILTGLYPPASGIVKMYDHFPQDLSSIPKLLQKAGVTTVGISAMGNVSSTFGFDQGFDIFLNLFKEEDIVEDANQPSKDRLFHKAGVTDKSVTPTVKDIWNQLEPILEKHAGDDLFVFLWGIDTHDPYDPLEEFRKYSAGQSHDESATYHDLTKDAGDVDWIVDRYDDLIRQVDYYVGEIKQKLKDLGVYDESMLVFTGDHGEAFGEKGIYGHSDVPYRELVHVPLIVKYPNNEHSGITNSPVGHVDLLPTLLNRFGVDSPRTQGLELPHSLDRRTMFTYTRLKVSSPTYVSVTVEGRKYIKVAPPELRAVVRENLSSPKRLIFRTAESLFGPAKSVELLNIGEDMVENTVDVEKRNHDFESLLQEWMTECSELREGVLTRTTREIDKQTEQQLRDMGYVK